MNKKIVTGAATLTFGPDSVAHIFTKPIIDGCMFGRWLRWSLGDGPLAFALPMITNLRFRLDVGDTGSVGARFLAWWIRGEFSLVFLLMLLFVFLFVVSFAFSFSFLFAFLFLFPLSSV